jgi:fimbrial chaperone protein
MNRRFLYVRPFAPLGLLPAVAVAVLLFPAAAFPGDWRVSPIRLDFGRDAKTGVVTVTNERPERLEVRLQAMEWTQDDEGKDRYAETGEIVFFPRFMIFSKDESRVVRAGIRIPAAAREKTYRLFIEEIPGPPKAEGTNIAVAIRFGVPIFVKPLKEEPKGELGPIGMSKGTASVLVKNTGNVHVVIDTVRIKGMNAKGDEIFSRDLAGWYLLAGASRPYATELPPEVCPNVARLAMEVKADKYTLTGNVDADKTMCAP